MTSAVTFETGSAKALFRISADEYEVSSDGQRFLAAIAQSSNVSPITVIINWTAALHKK